EAYGRTPAEQACGFGTIAAQVCDVIGALRPRPKLEQVHAARHSADCASDGSDLPRNASSDVDHFARQSLGSGSHQHRRNKIVDMEEVTPLAPLSQCEGPPREHGLDQ